MSERILLKKYANRRLYDTERSAYVTLTQVSDMIKEGRQVQVVDAKTNEDVTAFILTQVIVEEAKTNKALLPVPLLHLIIQYGEGVLSEFFDKYLESMINNYLNYKKALDDQFKQWIDLGSNLAVLPQKGFSSFPSFMDILADSTGKPKAQKEQPEEGKGGKRDE